MSDQKEDPKPTPKKDESPENETNSGGGPISSDASPTPPPRIPSSEATSTILTSSKKGRRTGIKVMVNNQNFDLPPPTSRRFAPLIHHRRPVRAYLSAEETMFKDGKNAANLPKQKSTSADALQGQGSTSESNNNPPTFKSYFFQGRPFRNIKVTPSNGCMIADLTVTPIAQGVLTVSPALVVTESETNQGQCQGQESPGRPCSKSSSKAGETCINMHGSGSTDSLGEICRICHDSGSGSEKLIKPCLCKGSMGMVHRSCLEHWLGESGKGSCEICGQEFNTVRVPKYKGVRSIIAWIRHPLNPTDSRNFCFDLACFFVLTPLALLSGWLCIVGAQAYTNEQEQHHKSVLRRHHRLGHETLTMRANRDVSNSTWTAMGLLSLTGTLVAAYMVAFYFYKFLLFIDDHIISWLIDLLQIWMFVAFRYHVQIWREWQQRNYIVTIVPLENGEFSAPPPPPPEEVDVDGEEHVPVDLIDLGHGGEVNANINNNVDGRGGGRRSRNVGPRSNQDSTDDGSPTTRFIQEMFIPSMENNWEDSTNVNNADYNPTDNVETGRRRSKSMSRNAGSSKNIDADEGSPTTRFILETFIPSMANDWEGSSKNVDTAADTNANDATVVTALANQTLTLTCDREKGSGRGHHNIDIIEELQAQQFLEEDDIPIEEVLNSRMSADAETGIQLKLLLQEFMARRQKKEEEDTQD